MTFIGFTESPPFIGGHLKWLNISMLIGQTYVNSQSFWWQPSWTPDAPPTPILGCAVEAVLTGPWSGSLVGGIPTILKNMKVNEKDDIPSMKWKIKNVWNHQPDPCFGLILQLVCWFSTTSSICCWLQSTASQLGSTSIICYQGRTYQKTQDQVLFCNFRLTPCFSPPLLSTVPSSKDVMKGDISSISCRICCWTCHTGGMPRVCSFWGPKQRGNCGSLLGKDR